MKVFLQFIMVILLPQLSIFAQTISVTDPVVRDYLCTNFPNAMVDNCKYLDTLKAESEYPSIDVIDLERQGIVDPSPLFYFTNADTIYLNRNAIDTVKTLNRIRSLVRLGLSHNSLKSAPDIRYNNKVSGDTAVKLVYLKHNRIDYLPNSWYQENHRTQVIDLYDNELSEIPSFENYSEIRRLDLALNRLDFEDLIPIKMNPLWETHPQRFTLFPQKEFFVSDSINVDIGDTLVFNISRNLESNVYQLMKENRRIDENRTGYFELSSFQLSDTGNYWFKIINDEFNEPSNFLASTRFMIDVLPKDKSDSTVINKVFMDDDIIFLSPDGDGIADYITIEGNDQVQFYDKSGIKLIESSLPFDWYGENQTGSRVAPGIYYIEIDHEKFQKILVQY